MSRQNVEFYTWNSHGNLGDDWIAAISDQFVGNTKRTIERRSLRTWPLGSHRLSGELRPDAANILCLWGGGWLASDQGNVDTLVRWRKHLRSRKGDVLGLGLGLGPFAPGISRVIAQDVLSEFTAPIVVRTKADLANAAGMVPAVLGGDVSFLDSHFTNQLFGTNSRKESYLTVISFPRYGRHWMLQRPWLTEEWYRDYVERLVVRQSEKGAVHHLQFDRGIQGQGDNHYWSGLPVEFYAPTSIVEAARHFSQAAEVYAGRLHAALLSIQLGKPTAALAYHHKFECVEETQAPVVGLYDAPSELVQAQPAEIKRVREISNRTLEAYDSVAPWLVK